MRLIDNKPLSNLISVKVNLVFVAPDPQKTIDSIKMHDVQNEVSRFLCEVRRLLS